MTGEAGTGGCACGAVRYRLGEPPLWTQVCHCRDCQRATGSSYAVNLWLPERAVHPEGETGRCRLPSGSGEGREQVFCPACGTQLFIRYLAAVPGLLFVRAGTLDDPGTVRPDAHIFVAEKQPWVAIPDDVASFEGAYDPREVWPSERLARLRALRRA